MEHDLIVALVSANSVHFGNLVEAELACHD
jgi:hypothetical protein